MHRLIFHTKQATKQATSCDNKNNQSYRSSQDCFQFSFSLCTFWFPNERFENYGFPIVLVLYRIFVRRDRRFIFITFRRSHSSSYLLESCSNESFNSKRQPRRGQKFKKLLFSNRNVLPSNHFSFNHFMWLRCPATVASSLAETAASCRINDCWECKIGHAELAKRVLLNWRR